jgi:hypothetical protein
LPKLESAAGKALPSALRSAVTYCAERSKHAAEKHWLLTHGPEHAHVALHGLCVYLYSCESSKGEKGEWSE